jgi:hypothetical protein
LVELHAAGRLVSRFTPGDWTTRLEILAWRTVDWTRSVETVLGLVSDRARLERLGSRPTPSDCDRLANEIGSEATQGAKRGRR